MPLFNVAVREHTYTGRFYNDVVQAGSPEEALELAAQHAVLPGPPTEPVQAAAPGPSPAPQHGFSVVVREQAGADRFRSDVVQAGSPEGALQVAAAQAAALEPPPGSAPRAEPAGRPRCADVWVYALLHCDLEAGHDPPHLAVARGYRRPVRWLRDDLGIAHPVPGPVEPPVDGAPDTALGADRPGNVTGRPAPESDGP